MRALAAILGAGLALVIAGLAIGSAGAGEPARQCLHSAVTAKAAAGAAWASYTLQLPGHHGERCWYPTTKALRHAHYPGAVYGLPSETEVVPAEHGKRSQRTPAARPGSVSRTAASRSSTSAQTAGAVISIVNGWRGEPIAVMPEADPHVVHWFLGDRLQAEWEPVFAGRERGDSLAADRAADAFANTFAAWRNSQPAGLTSIWIARQDTAPL